MFAAGLVLVVAVAMTLVGRWERERWIDAQVGGMQRIERIVGPLDQPALSGYRVLPAFDCLVYRRGTNPYALELCFDRSGRLVEAIDRLEATRRISSLRSDPGASTIHGDRREVDRLLRRMGAHG
ncbi:MAG: hypothetical protein ABR569_05155 [Gaiellaceae bacterium]